MRGRPERSSATGLLILLALWAVACGGPADDLFVVARSGSIPGATLAIAVRDDGSVQCDGTRRRLSDPQLLTARQLQRDLSAPAAAGLALPPGAQSVLSYSVRTAAGSVRFSDSSPRQPPVLYRLALFTRDVARTACGRRR